MTPKNANSKRTHQILWIVLALVTVTFIGSIALLFFWLRAPKPVTNTTATEISEPAVPPPLAGTAATSFADLSEATVAGRYKIDDAGKVMYIFLNEDHTFINQDGTTYPTYLWEVTPDRLTITWQRGSSTFTKFEQLGVYSRQKPDDGLMRMEKLPDLPPAEAMPFEDKDVVASMTFTATIEAQGLTVANTGGDGAISPGEAGGQECHHLIRQRGRVSAFLYARLAPELKTEPFTNAFVVVEYFDSPARDPRNGWISLQFDSPDGPYTSTAQRVKLNGSDKWTRATFVLQSPAFTGRENDAADFRLCVANPDLSIRSLKLVKNRRIPAPSGVPKP